MLLQTFMLVLNNVYSNYLLLYALRSGARDSEAHLQTQAGAEETPSSS